jgi:hypothetical protein
LHDIACDYRKSIRMKHIIVFAVSVLLMPLPGTGLAADGNCKDAAGQTDCAKQRKNVPRRAVPQNFERRSPTLSAPAQIPAPAAAIPPAMQSPPASHAPAPVTTCDAGGCWSPGGSRYQSGAGNGYLDSNGRYCQRNGAWMQCF